MQGGRAGQLARSMSVSSSVSPDRALSRARLLHSGEPAPDVLDPGHMEHAVLANKLKDFGIVKKKRMHRKHMDAVNRPTRHRVTDHQMAMFSLHSSAGEPDSLPRSDGDQ